MPKRKKAKSRIYWRERGGERRAYADFRDMGGKREPLVPPGEKRATTDSVIAEALVARRLGELTSGKRDGIFGRRPAVPLAEYVAHHLVRKAKSGKYSVTWLADTERMLRLAVEYFGADRDLASIEVLDVQKWAAALSERSNGRCAGRCGGRCKEGCGTLGGGAVRHHLSVLSNVFSHAQSEGRLPVGYNPCALMRDKPHGEPAEAEWLEVHEAALLLESARTFEPKLPTLSMTFIYPLVATYLLTGGRESEVLGMEVGDVNFDRKTVTFRPNEWRRLKTKKSHRTIPLWPQLEAILRDYLKSSARVGGLLFPSPKLGSDGRPAMLTDFRKVLDAVAERAGWKRGEIRSKRFRHTYCSARLQTIDNGAPVSHFTVAKEMGHSSVTLIDEVYGHMGDVRHRTEAVEYRVEQHGEKLAPKLELLRSA
ncbi:MAG: tyrosine-type recombinase/integrase [Gemmatimonadaceae bacterium]